MERLKEDHNKPILCYTLIEYLKTLSRLIDFCPNESLQQSQQSVNPAVLAINNQPLTHPTFLQSIFTIITIITTLQTIHLIEFFTQSIHPSVRPSVHPSIHPSIHPCIHPSTLSFILINLYLPTRSTTNQLTTPHLQEMDYYLLHCLSIDFSSVSRGVVWF